MTEKAIQHMVIVGGGSAGWMSACYLDRVYNHPGRRQCEITVVESPDVNAIGVGEATVHSLRFFLNSIGVSEADFMKNTNATLKHGICFRGWSKGGAVESDEYFHAFEQPKYNDGVSIISHWANLYGQAESSKRKRFDLSVSPQTRLALEYKSARAKKHKAYSGFFPYGYHIDAVLLGRYLRDIALSRGVKRIEAHVSHVACAADDGVIKTLHLKEGGEIEGDFFMDCTGFSSVLMDALDNQEQVDYSESLLCDRAVASQVDLDCDNGTSLRRPYTTSTAQDSGWIWDIDLYHRSGKGYVYASDYCSEDKAVTTLARHIGKRPEDLKINSLKMKTGRLKKPWFKNCVAIGLAAGFIEPLESTGLYFIDMGLRFLGEYIPSRNTPEIIKNKYNTIIGELVDQTHDFIVLHYILTEREDSEFWKRYKYDIQPSDRLSANLELWKRKLPTPADFADQITLFTSANYAYILYGMGFRHDQGLNTSLYVEPDRSRSNLNKLKAECDRAISTIPTHDSYLLS